MTAKVWSGSAALACAVWVAILGFASSAFALDAYWGGKRSSNWNEGRAPGTQVSNWYRDPTHQLPVRVPDRTAIFAGTAGRDVSPVISDNAEIGRILVEPNALPFSVGVERTGGLVINGAGIVNQSAATPFFSLRIHCL
jgi:hypothetical protein